MKIKVSTANALSIRTVTKTGDIATIRAGEIALVIAGKDGDGCRIYLSSSPVHVDSIDKAENINRMVDMAHKAAGDGFYEVAPPVKAKKTTITKGKKNARR